MNLKQQAKRARRIQNKVNCLAFDGSPVARQARMQMHEQRNWLDRGNTDGKPTKASKAEHGERKPITARGSGKSGFTFMDIMKA